MLVVRLSKLVMVVGLALFALLVAADNVADYGSNQAFVRHVLAMDTTFPRNALRWRAVTDPGLQTAAYWLIIAAEALTGALFGVAALVMAARLRASKAEFRVATSRVAAGAAVAFALRFVGFVVSSGSPCSGSAAAAPGCRRARGGSPSRRRTRGSGGPSGKRFRVVDR